MRDLTLLDPPRAPVETVLRSVVSLKIILSIDQVGFLSPDIALLHGWIFTLNDPAAKQKSDRSHFQTGS
jgi:hypothetical protein